MTATMAAKIGAAGTFAAGVPASWAVWNSLTSLSEIEKQVLEENGNVSWEISSQSTETIVTAIASATISKNEEPSSPITYTWKCKIIGDGVNSTNKDKFEKYLKNKLIETTTPELERKSNKNKLVWSCSKNHESNENNILVTTLKLKVENPEDENNISTKLFGLKTTTSA